MSRLRIAIQKSGRLHDESLKLLKSCGINVENGRDRLKVSDDNFGIDILYLRNSDIPQYLEDGIADIAIIGENLLVEKDKELEVLLKLGFSKCRVSLAVPKSVTDNELRYFEGKRIATSYPNTLRKFLKNEGVSADIHVISGSVEIAPNIGLADGICDIVSSGNTLFKNGLRETRVLMKSEAVLVRSRQLDAAQEDLLEQLTFRMRSVLRAKQYKYILLNVANENIDAVTAILPVQKSPTLMPLALPGWSSLHSVIDEAESWSVIESLRQAGAEDILIIPIDKMVK